MIKKILKKNPAYATGCLASAAFLNYNITLNYLLFYLHTTDLGGLFCFTFRLKHDPAKVAREKDASCAHKMHRM